MNENGLSPELIGVLIGGVIGFSGSIITVLINHWLTLRREKWRLKLDAEKELRNKLVEGISPKIFNASAEKLYSMIEEGRLPKSYALSQTLDEIIEEVSKETHDSES